MLVCCRHKHPSCLLQSAWVWDFAFLVSVKTQWVWLLEVCGSHLFVIFLVEARVHVFLGCLLNITLLDSISKLVSLSRAVPASHSLCLPQRPLVRSVQPAEGRGTTGFLCVPIYSWTLCCFLVCFDLVVWGLSGGRWSGEKETVVYTSDVPPCFFPS